MRRVVEPPWPRERRYVDIDFNQCFSDFFVRGFGQFYSSVVTILWTGVNKPCAMFAFMLAGFCACVGILFACGCVFSCLV